MRFAAFILIFISGLLLVSCSQDKLPAINDPQALRNDCLNLFQQFPTSIDTNDTPIPSDYMDENKWVEYIYVKTGDPQDAYLYTNKWFRDISTNSWPQSIQDLKPIAVHRDSTGITIWIRVNKHPLETDDGNWVAKGYFIVCGPHFSAKNTRVINSTPFFEEINLSGIYEIIEPAETD